MNIDDDSATIGPIIKRILYGKKNEDVGQKFIANHHFDIVILKTYNNPSFQRIPQRISREMGMSIYKVGCDGDYYIPGTDDAWCLPTLNFSQASDNYNKLLLKHNIKCKIDKLRKAEPTLSDLDQISKDLHENIRLVKEIYKEITNDKKIAELENLVRKEAANEINSAKRRATMNANKREAELKSLSAELQEEISTIKSNLDNSLHEIETLKELVTKYSIFYSSRLSGITRYTVTNSEFWSSNPEACNSILGFPTWDILVAYHKCFWPTINTNITDEITSYRQLNKRRDICDFERSIIWLLRVYGEYSLVELGVIFECQPPAISKNISKASKRWKFVSECITLLPISETFLRESMPKVFIDDHLSNVASLYDGKDFKVETIRSNSIFTRALWSDKVKHSALRIMTYSTPSGLVWLHSPAYFGRASEQRVVSELGSVESVKLFF